MRTSPRANEPTCGRAAGLPRVLAISQPGLPRVPPLLDGGCVTAGDTLLLRAGGCPGAASCPGARGGRWGSPRALPRARCSCGMRLGESQPAALSLGTKGRPHPSDARHGRRGGRLRVQHRLEVTDWVLLPPHLPLFLLNVPPSPAQAVREAVPQPRSRHTPRAPQSAVPGGLLSALCRAALAWGLKQNPF